MITKKGIFVIAILTASAASSARYKPSPEAAAGFQNAMEQMHNAMPEPSDNPDEAFVAMMIPHHQAAIDMTKIELEKGNDPRIKALAKKILDAQQAEIDQMKEWQRRPR